MKKLVLAVIALGFSVGVNAACDTKSLKGSYVINTTFTGLQNNSYPITCGQIGIINFDGKGGIVLSGTQSCSGQVWSIQKWAGNYSIDASCSGEIAFANTMGATNNNVTMNFVFDRALKTAQFMAMNPNGMTTFVGAMTKQ